MTRRASTLVLADGAAFEGWAIGAESDEVTVGEFVFNTALSGYQEVLTDPSYAGQVISFTYPHIGNYGVTALDDESSRPWCRGVVVRDLSPRPSNWRAQGSLESVPAPATASRAIAGVDTRRLTRHLRRHGALPGAFGPGSPDDVAAAARVARGTDGVDLVGVVTTDDGLPSAAEATATWWPSTTASRRPWSTSWPSRFRVTVVPASTTADEVRELGPDAVFLSNGPGDPAALGAQVAVIADLVGTVPIFGICLGHQLLATALGATTFKLAFGHHGSNHPVKDLADRARRDHRPEPQLRRGPGLALARRRQPRQPQRRRHRGDLLAEDRCFSVQYHPEAGPGPHDARYLFERFDDARARPARLEDR